MTAAQLFLGVEGGATRTTGVLAGQDMRVAARRVAGPTNVHAVGEAEARAAVAEIVDGLLAQAGIGWDNTVASALCIAGVRSPADQAVWRRIVQAVGVRGPVLVTHDAAAGLAAGSPDQTGVLVVCGTGSLVYGRRADGREHFVGGRGPVLGDEGSGFDIGQRGLRAAIRSADGRGEPTILHRLIRERLGLGCPDELVAWVSPFDKGRIAGVAPIVFEAASAGDEVADAIIQAAIDELARCVGIVARELWPPGSGSGKLERVVFSGGVLLHQPCFRRSLAASVGTLAPEAKCGLAEEEGAVGAARVARRWLRTPSDE